MFCFIFAANVFALAGNFVTSKNAKDLSISGNIKASASSSIIITSPSVSSEWYITGVYQIEWNWANLYSSHIDLFLYLGAVQKFEIASDVSTNFDSNSYVWTVPSNLTATASTYKIYAQEISNSSDNAFSAAFTINATVFLANCTTDPIVYLGTNTGITWSGTVSSIDTDLYDGTTHISSISSSSLLFVSFGITREFDWSVPKTLAGGSNYRIKITAHGNSSMYVYSPYFTVNTSKSILGVYISGMGPIYTTSITYVYWVSHGNIQNVDIDLYNGGTLVQNIVTSATNNNEYLWVVPGTLTTLTTYRIRVSDHDNPNVNYYYSDDFTINATHAISNVNTNSIVYQGGTLTINWDSTFPVKTVDIKLYQGSSQVAMIASSLVNKGKYYWIVTGSYSGSNYKILVSDHDQPSIYSFSNTFIINSSYQIVSVDIKSEVQCGNVGNMTWAYYGLISSVNIQLYKSGVFVENIVQNEPNSGSYNWLIPQSFSSGNNYTIKVSDYGQPSDYAISPKFNITAYQAPKMPWGVSSGENLKWTVGINIVMNFPDTFWQALDSELADMGIDVSSKAIYQAFEAAMPNSWNIKANVESLVHDSSSNQDDVIASLLMKENTNNTYATMGSYLGPFLQKMQTVLGPLFSFIYPGNLPSVPVDFGNHIPIGSAEPSLTSFGYTGFGSNIMPLLILPTNYSFSDNYNKMIASLQNNSEFISLFGNWSNFESMIGLTESANATGMQSSFNAFKMSNYFANMSSSLMTVLGMLEMEEMEEYSGMLNMNLTLTSLTLNDSVNYNSSMVLQKLASISVAQGKYTTPGGTSYDFFMSVEIYVFQGELSSITYLYHNPSSGIDITTILIFVGLASSVAAIVIVTSVILRKKTR